MPTNRKETIVRVITRLNVGGPSKHVAWLSTLLNERNWKNILLHGSIDNNENDLSILSKNIHSLFIPGMKRNISPIMDFESIWSTYKILKQHRPAIVHTHTAKAGMIGRVGALMYRILNNRKVKIVHTFHGHSFHGYFSKWKHKLFVWIERILARYATDAIVTISKQQQIEILNIYKVGTKEKHIIVPLGIDTSFVQKLDKISMKRDFNIPDGSKVFGIVGRIAPIKNHRLFISSIIEFNKICNDSNCSFLVIGDGDQTDLLDLKQYATDNKIDNLHFTGNLIDPAYFYGALDYLVLTSKNEGTPVSILEAFAAEIPVISTPAGGVVDLMGESERGIIAKPTSIDLANKYQYALTHDLTDTINKAKQYVYQNHSLEVLTDNIENIYSTLLGQTK